MYTIDSHKFIFSNWKEEPIRIQRVKNSGKEKQLYIISKLQPYAMNHSDLTAANHNKCRSQNAEKATHIKGRLLDQAMILFNCVPCQNGNFS